MKAIDYSSIIPYVFTMWPVGSHGVLMVASLLNDGAAKKLRWGPRGLKSDLCQPPEASKRNEKRKDSLLGLFPGPLEGP